ncbi:AzlD domain-containing protein [Allobaculum stercoricanis]|uniref:AzlD domain-containing protein n=1 Tax=Allobaculum stercoricanis TaxID=174709 RepID=UPI0003603C91|nr:AzlD domain-containing protein [Allobaculum stercoricanis]
MDSLYTYSAIIVMAVVTYIIRMIPMALFSKPIQSRFFQSFLYYVPYVVLCAMTFPGVFSSSLSTVACVLGVLVAIVGAWFGASMLQVAIMAAVVAYISQLIF